MTTRQKVANKLIQSEKGQALMLTLILLGVGGLILPPLMGFMSTGLIVGQALEEEMKEFYAADAGIEYGLWQIINHPADLPGIGEGPRQYPMADVNYISVTLTIELVFEEKVPDPPSHTKVFEILSTAGGTILVSYVEFVWE